MEAVITEEFGVKYVLVDGKHVELVYKNIRERRISNVPKSLEARKRMLASIEAKAYKNICNNKQSFEQQCENNNSRLNNYRRQWEAVKLLLEEQNGQFIDYNFGDVIA